MLTGLVGPEVEGRELVEAPRGIRIPFRLEALGEVLGVDIEFVNTAWDGIFAGLDKEQYDVIISSVSITPERQAAYDLTEPYVSNQLVIVTLK